MIQVNMIYKIRFQRQIGFLPIFIKRKIPILPEILLHFVNQNKVDEETVLSVLGLFHLKTNNEEA